MDPDLKVNPLQLLGDYSDDEEDGDVTPDVTPDVEENKAEPDANQPLPARQQEIECKVSPHTSLHGTCFIPISPLTSNGILQG